MLLRETWEVSEASEALSPLNDPLSHDDDSSHSLATVSRKVIAMPTGSELSVAKELDSVSPKQG